VHRSNRLEQRKVIREQTEILNALASPAGAYYRRFAPEGVPTPTPRDFERERAGTRAMLKEKWNHEVETLARKAYEVRWEDIRETAVAGFKTVSRLVKKE
jgi:altered-inheritance-of-mitochondria protein 5